MADLGFFDPPAATDDDPNPSKPETPASKLVTALCTSKLSHHPDDRIADPNDDPPSNSSDIGPDIVVIPDHYVPLDQIEYLRPADKLRQYALSPVTAHRLYLARSLPYILPVIHKQTTLNECLPRVFALATDIDPLVRTAVASALPDLFGAYLVAQIAASGSHPALGSTDSVHENDATCAADCAATDALFITPSTCVSIIQKDTPKDWNWNTPTHSTTHHTLTTPESPLPPMDRPPLLPLHLLNVTVLPLLVDSVRRIADLTQDSILRSLCTHSIHFPPCPSGFVPSFQSIEKSLPVLGHALADWALALLSLSMDDAQSLIDHAISAAASIHSGPSSDSTPVLHSSSSAGDVRSTPPLHKSPRFIDHSQRYRHANQSDSPLSSSFLDTKASSPSSVGTRPLDSDVLPPSAVVAAFGSDIRASSPCPLVSDSTSTGSSSANTPPTNGVVHSPNTLFISVGHITDENPKPAQSKSSELDTSSSCLLPQPGKDASGGASPAPQQLPPPDHFSLAPSTRSLLFYLSQPVNHNGPNHSNNHSDVSGSPTGRFGVWGSEHSDNEGGGMFATMTSITPTPSPPPGSQPSASGSLPIIKRIDDMHAALLEMIAETPLAVHLSESHRTQLLSLITRRFISHKVHAVRAAAAGALGSCVPTPDRSVLETSVFPTLTEFASDKSYLTRRRAAEACVMVMEHCPGSIQFSKGIPLVISVLDDASKNVRDVIYGGLPRIMLAIANGGTDPDLDSDLDHLVSPPDDEEMGDDLLTSQRPRSPLSVDMCMPTGMLPGEDDPIFTHPLGVSSIPNRALFPYRVPEEFIQTYALVGMKWKDPDRMAKCAYALPGIVAAFPSQWWITRFRGLFLNLARDPLADLRRPLISAIDVLARVIPQSHVALDLVPVVMDWLTHEDDVIKCLLYSKLPGILAQVADPHDIPIPMLRSIMDGLATHTNWHIRRIGARTLASWLQLYLRPGVASRAAELSIVAGEYMGVEDVRQQSSPIMSPPILSQETATATLSSFENMQRPEFGKSGGQSIDEDVRSVEPPRSEGDVSNTTMQSIHVEPGSSPKIAPSSPTHTLKSDQQQDGDEGQGRSIEDVAWTLIIDPMLTLLTDTVSSVRYSATLSISEIASLVSVKYQLDMAGRLTQLSLSETFNHRLSVAQTVSHWVPVFVREQSGCAEDSDLGRMLAPLVLALAQDHVLDVRLQLASMYARPVVQSVVDRVKQEFPDVDAIRLGSDLVNGLDRAIYVAHAILAVDPSNSVRQRVAEIIF